MIEELKRRFDHWRMNPRRWDPRYVVSSSKAVAAQYARELHGIRERSHLLDPPIAAEYVELLRDAEFRGSVEEARRYTLQDVARLANIWTLVKGLGPGTYLEAGSYRGGTALHICNAMPQEGSRFYCVDPFESGGYESQQGWEQSLKMTEFMDTSHAAVVQLLARKPFAHAIQGFFPAAVEPLDLTEIVFCHLDVNMYDATRKSLEYLAPRLARRGAILVDDYGHKDGPGVKTAVDEFVAAHPEFMAVPMFPIQMLLLPCRV